MKLCSCARKSFKHLRSRFALSKNEEGSFLVEILIASAVLLMIAATSVTQLTSLTKIKVQSETRDRAIILANGLHENMQAAGCGFDVSAVKEGVDTRDISSSGTIQQPWFRVYTCAYKAIEQARLNGSTIDEDGNLVPPGAAISNAMNFCTQNGESGRCEMGDQDFDREVLVNSGTTTIKFHITVNYWFEKTGLTTTASSCSSKIVGVPVQPDVIVRKVNIEWPNPTKIGDKEDITVIKRQNIPADSIEFSSSSRVGTYSDNNTVMISGITNLAGTVVVGVKVTRNKLTTTPVGNTSFDGGANCVWFPFIDRNAVAPNQVQFSVNGGVFYTPILGNTDPLTNKEL